MREPSRLRLPIYQIDAFTSRIFAGNPAAVVLMEEWLEDGVLQAIAAENNLAETAFVIPKKDICPLRWFTPLLEMDLCGHATLAAAHILLNHASHSREHVTFSTKSGTLNVSRDRGRLAMDFPSRPGRRISVTDALISALGTEPREAFLARDLLVVFDSEADVRTFRPDYSRIAELDAFALIISAPGEDADFVSRFFAPKAGVPEDPVTGSAHCTLVPYWATRLGKRQLVARQLSKRGGELHCEFRGDRVIIGGQAVEYLHGEISIDQA